jgi:hypothetical protein
LVFSRNLKGEDWARALPLFARVHALHYLDWKSPRLDSSLFDRVGVTRPTLHFLPSLRALEHILEHDSPLSSVPLFFASTLTRLSLRVGCQQDEDLVQYAIGEIRPSSRLNHLELRGCFQRVPRGIVTLDTIQCLQHLESVNVDAPRPMFSLVFAALSHHPKLKHAKLSYCKSQISEVEQYGLPSPGNSDGIAMLETIVVGCYAPITLSDAFNGRQFESIREFKATKVSVLKPERVRDFLSDLVAACPMLEVFHASFTTPYLPTIPSSFCSQILLKYAKHLAPPSKSCR